MSSLFPPQSTLDNPPKGLSTAEPADSPEPDPSSTDDIGSLFADAPAEGESVGDSEPAQETDHQEEIQEQAQAEAQEDTPPEAAGDKAKQRFQRLANEKKEAIQKAAELEGQNRDLLALVEALKENTAVGREQWGAQRELISRRREKQADEDRRLKMLQSGFDPADTKDQFAFGLAEDNERLRV